MGQLSNIPLKTFRNFLEAQGLTIIRTKGGHEMWGGRPGLQRSITLQSHIDPVPEFIILNNLRTLGVSRKEFVDFLKKQ